MANMIEQELTELIVMISELHMTTINRYVGWQYDSGATMHVFYNKILFKNYADEELLMENNDNAKSLAKEQWNYSLLLERSLSFNECSTCSKYQKRSHIIQYIM